jgi:spore coat polysaccharide biosynthesis protein SpsF
MRQRIGIILQARFNSTRLRGKALASVGGTSVLKRCLNRLRQSQAGHVVLATTDRPEDDALAAAARRIGVDVFRGCADDVLARYVDAAVWHDFDVVIRATGDNPAVDIDAPRRLIGLMHRHRADYACEDGLPYGAAVEIVSTAALAYSASQATRVEDREHVTTFIKLHPSTFRVIWASAPRSLRRPDVRLTIDTAEDLAFMRRVFARARSVEPPLTDLIAAADECSRSNAA